MSDIENGLRLSITEGWNQTEKDWKLLIEKPGNICLVAKPNKSEMGNQLIFYQTDFLIFLKEKEIQLKH